MTWVYVLIFVLCAVGGFFYGTKMHLRRVSSVMLQCGMNPDQVGKIIHLVSNYRKLQKQAKKQAREAYKKSVVDGQLQNMTKENFSSENNEKEG